MANGLPDMLPEIKIIKSFNPKKAKTCLDGPEAVGFRIVTGCDGQLDLTLPAGTRGKIDPTPAAQVNVGKYPLRPALPMEIGKGFAGMGKADHPAQIVQGEMLCQNLSNNPIIFNEKDVQLFIEGNDGGHCRPFSRPDLDTMIKPYGNQAINQAVWDY